jgi:CheY-like chemotaxis protein
MELNQARVMVIDDQAVMRILIVGSLRKLGVQHLHAYADGASA